MATIGDLIKDVLPRLTSAPKGISIIQAANSVQSLIYKRLLSRDSDLVVSGDLSLTIPALGYTAALPADFVAPAERPYVQAVFTDWMAGTVTSYNAETGALVVNVLSSIGSDTLAAWSVATAATPDTPSSVIGESTTSLTPGAGAKSLTITTGLTLPAGTYVYIIPSGLPESLYTLENQRRLEPEGLREDDHADPQWWNWYGSSSDGPAVAPSHYKIIGTTFYCRPKVAVNVTIKGRYHAKPTAFTGPTDTIPWGLFDEVFREGVVRIIVKGISIPAADPDFALFINGEVDTVVNSRIRTLPTVRTSRRNFV